ncbi:peptidoglycan endopeptidase LytF/peptidoglycan endopeptidase LytE [Salinibacillus kushneri]|uniref:Peptidoglycan endopeptidase LytF/peptidoglycan endopeptidase LytE n=1 Tax=Salinibacillus kushneri TaxID=237682 RepID=A0A1I0JKI6_9BACI|nr:LysM peptidoglycan-binding domain-containing protein [Salinibacillus kushneri]SEU10039.1 peptidoglycan endopeptidase LytF/peptidoglycan endopeptidase LytE [Salinibacillus kushneri]
MKVTMIKVMVGGIAITSIPLMGSDEIRVEAAEKTITYSQASVQDSIYYQVSAGDNLWKLSRNFQTSVDEIKRANNLTSDAVYVNQSLIIPKAMHTVMPGESLTTLAKKYDTTVDGMKEVNHLNSDLIRVGQILIIPAIVSSQSARSPEKSTSYTVMSGDSLWGIANRYDVSVNAIKSANDLTSNVINVGQTLTIPGGNAEEVSAPTTVPSTDNIQYKITSSDTLWSIAQTYGVEVDAIRSSNNLESAPLHIGQTLIIPKDEKAISVPAVAPVKETERNSYKVQSGDTLYGIARAYHTTVDKIKKANNLNTNTLTIGQILTIPSSQTDAQKTTGSSSPQNESNLELVQKGLQKLGYYAVQTMTGSYDNPTKEAIRDFQSDYGLSVTGTADDKTKTAIEHAVLKQDLMKDTKNYLGVPYLWGGTTPSGFDCSGFVYYMFNKHGVDMPRDTAAGLFTKGTSVSQSALQPGDLVFYAVNSNRITHVGFYIGDNQWISATSSKGIAIYSLDNSYWSKYYEGAKRIY